MQIQRNGTAKITYKLTAPEVTGMYKYRLRIRNIYIGRWQFKMPEGDGLWGDAFEVPAGAVKPPPPSPPPPVGCPPDAIFCEPFNDFSRWGERAVQVRDAKIVNGVAQFISGASGAGGDFWGWTILKDLIPVSDGEYLFTTAMRTVNVAQTHIVIQGFDQNRNELGQITHEPGAMDGTTDWRTYSRSINLRALNSKIHFIQLRLAPGWPQDRSKGPAITEWDLIAISRKSLPPPPALKPDLVITGITSTTDPLVKGEVETIRVNYRNDGETGTREIELALYGLSGTRYADLSNLAAKQEGQHEFQVQFQDAGTVTLKAAARVAGDANESNNEKTVEFSVGPAGGGGGIGGGPCNPADPTNLICNGDFAQGFTGWSTPLPYPRNVNAGAGILIVDFRSCDQPVFAPVFLSQRVVVEPNTDYEFSARVTSIYPVSPAVVEFRINGTSIAQMTAPAVNSWAQCRARWNSGPNRTALVEVANLNSECFGNDFGLDDLELRRVGGPIPLPPPKGADLSFVSITALSEPLCASDSEIFRVVYRNDGDTGSGLLRLDLKVEPIRDGNGSFIDIRAVRLPNEHAPLPHLGPGQEAHADFDIGFPRAGSFGLNARLSWLLASSGYGGPSISKQITVTVEDCAKPPKLCIQVAPEKHWRIGDRATVDLVGSASDIAKIGTILQTLRARLRHRNGTTWDFPATSKTASAIRFEFTITNDVQHGEKDVTVIDLATGRDWAPDCGKTVQVVGKPEIPDIPPPSLEPAQLNLNMSGDLEKSFSGKRLTLKGDFTWPDDAYQYRILSDQSWSIGKTYSGSFTEEKNSPFEILYQAEVKRVSATEICVEFTRLTVKFENEFALDAYSFTRLVAVKSDHWTEDQKAGLRPRPTVVIPFAPLGVLTVNIFPGDEVDAE